MVTVFLNNANHFTFTNIIWQPYHRPARRAPRAEKGDTTFLEDARDQTQRIPLVKC